MSNSNDNVPQDDLDIVDIGASLEAPIRRLPVCPDLPEGMEERHFHMCKLASEGKTEKEIAKLLATHPNTVRSILAEPKSKTLITKLVARGCDNPDQRIKEDAEFAQKQLRPMLISALRQNKLDVARRIAADMVNRYYGTPTARVEHAQVDPDKISDEELMRIATGGVENPQS